jgi:hypothetical protein
MEESLWVGGWFVRVHAHKLARAQIEDAALFIWFDLPVRLASVEELIALGSPGPNSSYVCNIFA